MILATVPCIASTRYRDALWSVEVVRNGVLIGATGSGRIVVLPDEWCRLGLRDWPRGTLTQLE